MTKAVVRVGGPNSTADARRLIQEWSVFENIHREDADTTKGLSDVGVAIATTITSLDMLRVLWGWWRQRSGSGCTARVELPDGTRIELVDVSQEQLEQLFAPDLAANEASALDGGADE